MDTMPSSNEKLISKIAALVAKAERTDNEHEREAFWTKANELITKHGLELSEIMDKNKDDAALKISHKLIPFAEQKSHVKDWKVQLGSAVGTFCMVGIYIMGRTKFLAVGREVDILIYEQLVKSIINQIEAACERDILKALNRGEVSSKGASQGYTHPRTWRQSYYVAAADRVATRVILEVAQRKRIMMRESAGKSNALMVVTEKAIEDHSNEHFGPTTGKYEPNPIDSIDWSAAAAGDEAGRKVHLGPSLDIGRSLDKLGSGS